jgi:uncharacterized membrane protein
MNASTPTSIAAYLQALRQALHGADPALIQDALYDAEQHLRAELAARSELDEAVAIAQIVNSYGAPDEVAAAYRETESRVQAAMAMPRAPKAGTPSSAVGGAPPVGVLRRFFGVYGDVRSWTALFYCLLALFTGIFYFSFVTIGLSLSLGLSILIIGVPFFVAFIGSARLLALVEGRIVEAMTGERMPRRPVSPPPESSLLQRIGAMLKDWRTWSTLAYEALMLPLGLVYFSVTVTALAIGLALMLAALAGGTLAATAHTASSTAEASVMLSEKQFSACPFAVGDAVQLAWSTESAHALALPFADSSASQTRSLEWLHALTVIRALQAHVDLMPAHGNEVGLRLRMPAQTRQGKQSRRRRMRSSLPSQMQRQRG